MSVVVLVSLLEEEEVLDLFLVWDKYLCVRVLAKSISLALEQIMGAAGMVFHGL